jgi:pectinesterase
MEGVVAASIEYRTSDEAKFPAAVQDVKTAVRWMRAHAVEYGINPDAIGAIGGSAGAHLVAMLATSGGVTELEGVGGNPGTSSDVQAVVAMGGRLQSAMETRRQPKVHPSGDGVYRCTAGSRRRNDSCRVSGDLREQPFCAASSAA